MTVNVETLQNKRNILVAQRDQLNANMNATLGAIAMVDELIAEAQIEAASEKSRQLSEATAQIAAEVVPPVVLDPAHSLAPEMLPVTHEVTACVDCGDSDTCNSYGCQRVLD